MISIDWEEIIGNQFKRLNVLVVGDIILDHYIWGEVERTSPEAPVPVVNIDNEKFGLGGAANVAHNVARTGAKVSLVGLIGNDTNGKRILRLLKPKNISTDSIIIDSRRPTILKTRIVSKGQQLLRIDREESGELPPELTGKLVAQFKRKLDKVDGIIFCDYAKGVLNRTFLQLVIKMARQKKIKLVTDPKGVDFSKYRFVDAITPNIRESRHATGLDIKNDRQLITAGKNLLSMARTKAVAITRGAEGISLFQARHEPQHIPGHGREVFDITGAGDTFVSYFSLAYFSGLDFTAAARLGNYAGALAVSKFGAIAINPEELITFVKGETYPTKRRELSELIHVVQALKAQGRKIVFTNGCFDLIHIGHIKFLEAARQLGDCLIVAVNSDSSVRELKEPPRPIINEEERADILAALHCVDYVTIFHEPTPISIIKALKPNILVKGKNLRPEEISGRDIVLNYGGKVKRLPMFHEISTQQLIETIVTSEKDYKNSERQDKKTAGRKRTRKRKSGA